MDASIVEKINSTFQTGFEIPAEKLKPEAHLIHDLELDSLDMIDLLVHLEDHLGTKIDGEKIRGIQTLQDVYGLVDSVLRTKETSATL